tara:strand:+ start:345 stop:1664 length:1320 start_codon:yes stop_codon:yes gene_type:complete
MAALDAVLYEKFIIESTDGKKTVDLKEGVVFFSYFENVFSPHLTAKVQISNTGNTVEGEDGVMTSVYNGLPLIGGERVIIKISGNSPTNKGLDFSDSPEKYFYVSSITNILIDAEREAFTLNLISREALTNETVRVGRKFPSSQKISDSVRDILKKYVKTEKELTINETENPYGFIGNLKKPFSIITWLAAKSVSSSKGSSTGFLFYETQFGYNFTSIDDIISSDPYENDYVYAPGIVNDRDPKKDFKIKEATLGSKDLLEKLQRGGYASQRFYINPVSFKINSKTLFVGTDYQDNIPNLGEKILNFFSFDKREKSISELPSRIFSAVLDVGTLEKNAKLTGWNDPSLRNADPAKIHSQAMIRYQQLKSEVVTIQIPVNMNLTAGSVIRCNFPRIDTQKRKEPDQSQSGLYMITKICHFFNKNESVSQIEMVRDTKGRK